MREEIIYKWYYRLDVQYAMTHYVKRREFAMIVPNWKQEERHISTRYMRVDRPQDLQFHFSYNHFFTRKRTYNLYMSLARYEEGIPRITVKEWTKEKKKEWSREHWKHMVSYDMLIDIDSPSHDEDDIDNAKYSALRIWELLEEQKYKFECNFSGKGFHFLVDKTDIFSNISKDPNEKGNLYHTIGDFLNVLYDEISEMVDTSVSDSRRLVKIPYTLALYEKEIYVCHPIKTKQQLETFILENAKVDKFKEKIKV